MSHQICSTRTASAVELLLFIMLGYAQHYIGVIILANFHKCLQTSIDILINYFISIYDNSRYNWVSEFEKVTRFSYLRAY